MPYCFKCGKELPGTAKFCSNCGVQVTQNGRSDRQLTQESKQLESEGSMQDEKARLDQVKQIRKQGVSVSHEKKDSENGSWESRIDKTIENFPAPSVGIRRLAVILFIVICVGLTIAMIVMGIVEDDTFMLWFSIAPAVITIWAYSGLRTLKEKKRRNK